jgi:hypothetical protein
MSHQQRGAVNQMMAQFPLDLSGDAIEQRAVFERMMTARPLPDDVTTASGSLGGSPCWRSPPVTHAQTPCCCGSTAAGTRWDHHAPAPRCLATSRDAQAQRSCRSTIASLPSIRIPRRRRTPTSPTAPCSTAAPAQTTSQWWVSPPVEASSFRRSHRSPTRGSPSQPPPCSSHLDRPHARRREHHEQSRDRPCLRPGEGACPDRRLRG